MKPARYAVRCIRATRTIYTYFCNADLIENVKYWAREKHPGCRVEVESAD